MLQKVRYCNYSDGIDVQAYTDGYAYDEYSNLYLFSTAGYDSSVKAITSALVSGRKIDIIASPSPLYLSGSFAHTYKILSAKLGSGLLHQIVLDDRFLKFAQNGHKFIYVDNDEHISRIVYDSMKRSYSVPLIPEWSEWLCERIKEKDGLEELSGTREVLKLTIGEEELESIVSEGIKNGEIDF